MRELFERQRRAFLEDPFPSAKVRVDRLRRVKELVRAHQDELIDACGSDFGSHSRHQAQMSEIFAVMTCIDHALKNVRHWMKPERRRVDFPLGLLGARARVEYQPKGVVGNISTWNFPVYVSLSPLAGIFAAGNRAMIKFSEYAPQTAELLHELIARYFDDSECTGITGGPDVGAAFASLPFDHLLFTGGTATGRLILRAAAENLTPVTLEMGGKSPVIVGRSYPIGKAAERIMTGKALNVGQACLAPDYCFVPRESLEAFAGEATRHVSAMFPAIVANPDYTSIVNERHFRRLTQLIDDAAAKGADVRQINPAGEDFSDPACCARKLPMTLVIEPTDDMAVMQEEIFGPILCVKTYGDLRECIDYINARPRPLGLYYFGNDRREQRWVLEHTTSGGVTVNDVLVHASCEDLPFGGIGPSGMGAYHGYAGFLTFSHQKAVYRQSPLDLMKMGGMIPPYGEQCQKRLDKMTRR
ncbi:MAG: coniferyl aldehyde dehydrogenase [Deltaproteobacteria bacterium]|nr:MAG: coniferyl aldehyde dehydrogenase [Deltaproteobacteria bacterium]